MDSSNIFSADIHVPQRMNPADCPLTFPPATLTFVVLKREISQQLLIIVNNLNDLIPAELMTLHRPQLYFVFSLSSLCFNKTRSLLFWTSDLDFVWLVVPWLFNYVIQTLY